MPPVTHSLAAVAIAHEESPKAASRERLGFLVHEPLLQFIALGLVIWGGVEYSHAQNDRYTIHVGSAERRRISIGYLQQFGQFPTPDQLHGLINRYIREEIFLREGLALNLEKNDEIIRRRIIQKYEFLQTDLAAPDSPGFGELERWFEQNPLRYLTPERVAFSHVYFSADQAGEEAAKVRALKVLKELRGMHVPRAPGLGDAFPGPSDLSALDRPEAARVFGQAELSEHLFKIPVGQWAGPYRSGYGWHLIYVTGHFPPALPSFSQVHELVLADYLEEQRRNSNANNFEKLQARYIVRYEGERR